MQEKVRQKCEICKFGHHHESHSRFKFKIVFILKQKAENTFIPVATDVNFKCKLSWHVVFDEHQQVNVEKNS